MMYLIIVFISPLYFLIRGKIGGLVLNSILYLIALGCVVSLIFAWVGVFFWALAVGHAAWHLRREFMIEHAEMIATKIAAVQMQGQLSASGDTYDNPKDTKKCPMCAETVKLEAKICKHCGHKFTFLTSN
jgi:hypothetical protein